MRSSSAIVQPKPNGARLIFRITRLNDARPRTYHKNYEKGRSPSRVEVSGFAAAPLSSCAEVSARYEPVGAFKSRPRQRVRQAPCENAKRLLTNVRWGSAEREAISPLALIPTTCTARSFELRDLHSPAARIETNPDSAHKQPAYVGAGNCCAVRWVRRKRPSSVRASAGSHSPGQTYILVPGTA